MTPLGTNSKSFFSRLGDVFLGVVAPVAHVVPAIFRNPCPDKNLFDDTIAEIQKFRGRVYLDEEAIPASALDPDARHLEDLDYQSWHLFILDQQMRVCGCVRLTPYSNQIHRSHLRVHEAIQRMPADQAELYIRALDALIDESRRSQRQLAEIGGWAVLKEFRNTSKAMLLASACWSLGHLLGHGTAVALATKRNRSAEILRRLGGSGLSSQGVELPAFFESYYGCEVDILIFDSKRVPVEYERTMMDIMTFLSNALVLFP